MNDIISQLSQALLSLHGMKMLLHVGRGRVSLEGKVDLLAGCVEGDIARYSSEIESLLRSWQPSGNFYVCDDSVRFETPLGSGGVAVCDSTKLVRQIKGWIKGRNLGGQHRPWAVGYWLPEALCGDLATAEILHDVEGIGTQIMQLVTPYPGSLSRSIVEWCSDEIRQKLSLLERLIGDEKSIEHELCLSDITASLVRLAFARSRKYLRGFRSLEEQAKLLKPSDYSVYQLALKLSQREGLAETTEKIRRLF
jgi:hypothetical protein